MRHGLGQRLQRALSMCGVVAIVAMAATTRTARGQAETYLQAYSNVLLQHYGQAEGSDKDSGRTTMGSQPSEEAGTTLDGVYVATIDGTEVTAFPHAFGLANASANGGDLHASAKVGTTTDLHSLHSGSVPGNYLIANASARAWWQDVVTIETDNPAGSDYHFKLKLDGSISWDYDYDYVLNGSIGVGVSASVTGSSDTGIFTLDTFDSATTGLGGERDFERYAEKTIHLAYGSPVTYTLLGSISAGAQASNLTAFLTADVSHTALFAINTTDPLAHYTSQSGTVFAADTPEPTTMITLAGCVGPWLIARRRQSA